MANELFIKIKQELKTLYRTGNTLAGTNVRTGKTIPLNDPYSPYIAPEDIEPLIVLQMKKLQYDNTGKTGARAQYTRIADFQIDGYL